MKRTLLALLFLVACVTPRAAQTFKVGPPSAKHHTRQGRRGTSDGGAGGS